MPEQIQDPINAFPEYMQKIIYHYCEAKGYNTDFFLTAVLGAVSTAMGRSVTLQTGNYKSIASIWAIILGLRGQVKSPPLEDAFEPLNDYQGEINAHWLSEKEELEQYKADNPKAKTTELKPPKKTLLNDITPEKLVMTLADNQKGCGIYYDEIAGFIGSFNRYNASNDEKMYLSLFNGGSIMRDRVNNNSSAYAKTSYLSIIGTTQPSVLKEVFFNKIGSGFFDRWLISYPKSIVKQYPNRFGINPVEQQKYKQIIHNLLALEYDPNNFNQMSYTNESYAIVNDFQCKLIDEENETTSDDTRGILAKMEIYLHKFALILQAIEYAITSDINDIYFVSEASANGAVILTKYFIDQSILVRQTSPIEQLKDVWIDIYKALPNHGKSFDRMHFVKVCASFKIGERAADNFLKSNSDRSENLLFYKVKHGEYNKNIF